MHDLFGIVPDDHPDPRRLALHQFWPDGYHPLRRDVVAPRRTSTTTGQPFPFRTVEGEGIFEITVGPVHAGIIEPGHFRFSVEGETDREPRDAPRLRAQGHREAVRDAAASAARPELAERISGDTSVGHALAYCRALETLAGCVVPRRAAALRAVLLEMERLYNHVGDVGMIVNDTGFAFGHAHCFRLREELLRLNERLTGHRLLRGAVVPGGVAGARAGRLRRSRARGRRARPGVRRGRAAVARQHDGPRAPAGHRPASTRRRRGRCRWSGWWRAPAASTPTRVATRRSHPTTRSPCACPSTTRATCGRAPWCGSTRRGSRCG